MKPTTTENQSNLAARLYGVRVNAEEVQGLLGDLLQVELPAHVAPNCLGARKSLSRAILHLRGAEAALGVEEDDPGAGTKR